MNDGVHRANGLGLGVDLVTVGDDQLLVGNRHIDGGKVPLFHKGSSLCLGGQGNQIIVIPGQLLVDDFGIAVPQLGTNQTVSFLFHSGSHPFSIVSVVGKPWTCANVP